MLENNFKKDERGYTLQTLIIVSVLALAAVGASIVLYNVIGQKADAVAKAADFPALTPIATADKKTPVNPQTQPIGQPAEEEGTPLPPLNPLGKEPTPPAETPHIEREPISKPDDNAEVIDNLNKIFNIDENIRFSRTAFQVGEDTPLHCASSFIRTSPPENAMVFASKIAGDMTLGEDSISLSYPIGWMGITRIVISLSLGESGDTDWVIASSQFIENNNELLIRLRILSPAESQNLPFMLENNQKLSFYSMPLLENPEKLCVGFFKN